MNTVNLIQKSARLCFLTVVCSCAAAVRAQTLTLEQALDTTNLVWTTGGDGAWFGQTTNSYDGDGAACSVLPGPRQTSWLQTTVAGPGTVSYWSQVNDGASGLAPALAFLGFAVNPGPGPGPASPGFPSRSWTQSLYDLPAGTNVLRWSFAASLNATNGPVAAFVDQVLIGPPRPLQIVYGPSDQTVYARQMVLLGVNAVGTPPLSYQWLKDGASIPDATNASLFFATASTNDSGVYSVIVTSPQTSVQSTNALLTVLPPSPPIISCQPMDESVYCGQTAYLFVCTDGSPPLTYQWLKNGTNLSGTTAASLLLTNVQFSDAGTYSLQVSNTEGSTVSSNAVLSVLPCTAPVITAQPCSLNVAAGAAPVLAVQASAGPAPQYQWLRNGTNLPGASFSSLSFTNVSAADAGVYSVRVANFLGAAQRRDALLTVLSAPSAIGSWFQTVESVTVTNGLAWLAQGAAGVGVLNVADPANPFMIGGSDTPGQAVAVRLAGNLACVADGFGGLQILSITNPAKPVLVGTYAAPDSAQDVAVVGNTAYIAASSAGLRIVDLSNPAQPLLLGSFVTNMSAWSVRVLGNRAYVGCPTVVSPVGQPMTAGLQIIDVGNPSQAALLGNTGSDTRVVDVQGNIALTAGFNTSLDVFDVSDPTAPAFLDGYAPPGSTPPLRPRLFVSGLQLAGNLAYVACGNEGLWVLDVTVPSAPVNVARFATSAAVQNVAVAGNTAYVALGEGGLQIIALPAGLGVQPSPSLTLSQAAGLKLALTGPAGAQATVEYADSLSGGTWQPLQTLTLTGAAVVLDISATGTTHRFFRAQLLWP